MDPTYTAFAGLANTLKTCYDLGRVAVGMRDAVKLGEAVSEINNNLLDAQQRLFSLSATAIELQEQLRKVHQENLELQATLQQRGRYVLVEIAQGNFAYRSKVDSNSGAEDLNAEPPHYVCQPCFDKGTKAILGMLGGPEVGTRQACPVCSRVIVTARRIPRGLASSSWQG